MRFLPRRRVIGLGVLIVGSASLALGTTTSAHDQIESSDPENGAVLDEPISHVTIDFGEEIADDLEMALVYDLGNSDVEEVPSEVSKVDEQTGRIDFEELDREGRYFVRYLATVPLDGHVQAGAITFDYGESGGGTNWGLWMVVGPIAVAILAIGAYLSFRPRAAQDEENEPVG